MRTIPLLAVLALPLVLASCGSAPDLSTPQGQCQAQAENDPAVVALKEQFAGGALRQEAVGLEQLGVARRRAYMACMRARGLAPPGGGVQPVQ